MLENGSREEVSLRVASILAVEKVRKEMVRMWMAKKKGASSGRRSNGRRGKRGYDQPVGSAEENADDDISSVLIDFYLWDLAKRIEDGIDEVEGIETAEMVPIHRTRSIWY